ncbi:MAG: vanadium-dependent haloperoxidase [Blastocatellia bacterium]
MRRVKSSIYSVFAVLTMLTALSVTIKADAVSDWNAIAQQATITGARPGPSGVIDVAMVHAAIYDAVQAIEGEYEPYYVDIPGASGSPLAATAKAAHDVLVSRFPAQAAALGITYQNYLIANGILLTDPGIAVGATAAAGIMALRACDGSFPPGPPTFIGGTGIGVWRPTPPANSPMNPGPWLGQVTPFLLTRPFQFRSEPPPALDSRRYARDYNEVKAFGGALNTGSRTPEQTDQAFFWAGNFPVMFNKLTRDLAAEKVDNISDSSRLFALVTMSQADAIIAVWNDKAYYVFWRPITAIQNGDLDGNSRTVGDPTWTSLIANPPYPDHTSGANGITGAMMRALRNFFRRDRMDFSITTTNTGPTTLDTREFERFSDAAQEVVDARIYLGIHFRFADEGGRTLGFKVADWGYRNYFRPINRHDHMDGGDDDDNDDDLRKIGDGK